MFLRASSAIAALESRSGWRSATTASTERASRSKSAVSAELRVAALGRGAERALHADRGPVAGQVGADEQRRAEPRVTGTSSCARCEAYTLQGAITSTAPPRISAPTSSPRLRSCAARHVHSATSAREHERHRQQVRARQHRGAEREPADAEDPRAPEPRGDRQQRERDRQPERAERLGQLLAGGEDQRRIEADERRGGHPRPRPRQQRRDRERRQRRPDRDDRLQPVGARDVERARARLVGEQRVAGREQHRAAGRPVQRVLEAVAVGVLVGDPDREAAVGALVGGLVARGRVLGPVGMERERAREHREQRQERQPASK